MKKTIPLLLRVLGLKREKPQTKIGRLVRHGERVIGVAALVYVCLQIFPHVFFEHSVQAHGIHVYSTEPIDWEVETVLSEIRSKVDVSPLARDDLQVSLFLCNSRWLYAFFSPVSRDSFAIANPVSGHIFLADGDFSLNRSERFGTEYKVRTLTGVITHEIGHVLMRDRFGYWTNFNLPTWLKEGYCETLAGESSFPEGVGDSLIAEGKSERGASFRYFTYRRMVEYLIQDEDRTIEELVRNPPDVQRVRQRTQEWLRGKLKSNVLEETPVKSGI